MKNHFYISYAGNKREEVEKIFENIDFTGITTIIEPFCGTCAVSYYISTKIKGLKYILNDLNENFMKIFEILKDVNKTNEFKLELEKVFNEVRDNKEKYVELVKQKTLVGWFISNKYYQIRPGLFPIQKRNVVFDFENIPIVKFFRDEDITFSSCNANQIIDEYKDKSDAMIFIDPPYIDTCNQFYDYGKSKGINIYEYLYYNDINDWKCNPVLVLEKNWIIALLFQNHKIVEYDKSYQTTKKKTTHFLIKKS